MIEQTDLVVNQWIYIPPINASGPGEKITSHLAFDVMKKRASTKKGIACRFSCKFVSGNDTILLYVAEDSYVIDLEDKIDKDELLRMIRNSHSKFTEKFDSKKTGTVLQDRSIIALDESLIDLNTILPLLD